MHVVVGQRPTLNYALTGKALKIKHLFGQLIDSGTFNIYFVLVTGYNALSGAIQTYPNFLFEKKDNNSPAWAAYPFAIRMKDKKYEKAKAYLTLFKDYPEIVEKVKGYQQENNFLEILQLIKTVNRQ